MKPNDWLVALTRYKKDKKYTITFLFAEYMITKMFFLTNWFFIKSLTRFLVMLIKLLTSYKPNKETFLITSFKGRGIQRPTIWLKSTIIRTIIYTRDSWLFVEISIFVSFLCVCPLVPVDVKVKEKMINNAKYTTYNTIQKVY